MTTIYVLRCEGDRFYVGKTSDVDARVQQHTLGTGSAWTKRYPPLFIERTYENMSAFDEDRITKELMATYGIDKVRGGSYVTMTLSDAQVNAVRRELRMAQNLCVRCGRSGHFVTKCYAKTEIVDGGATATIATPSRYTKTEKTESVDATAIWATPPRFAKTAKTENADAKVIQATPPHYAKAEKTENADAKVIRATLFNHDDTRVPSSTADTGGDFFDIMNNPRGRVEHLVRFERLPLTSHMWTRTPLRARLSFEKSRDFSNVCRLHWLCLVLFRVLDPTAPVSSQKSCLPRSSLP